MNDTPELDEATAPRAPQQGEMPFAIVHGDPVTELPRDLYIPPHALEVFLEVFEGPLDLLLYLIKRHNLDILDIPIAEITRQYMEYIELMKELRLELAAEYLVMAAMLAEIKSRMLLPRHEEVEDEKDPRAELIRRLQEYEQYKEAAESLQEMPRVGRDVFRGGGRQLQCAGQTSGPQDKHAGADIRAQGRHGTRRAVLPPSCATRAPVGEGANVQHPRLPVVRIVYRVHHAVHPRGGETRGWW